MKDTFSEASYISKLAPVISTDPGVVFLLGPPLLFLLFLLPLHPPRPLHAPRVRGVGLPPGVVGVIPPGVVGVIPPRVVGVIPP